MFLNEEEQSKLYKNKRTFHKKRKKISKNNNYFLKYSNISYDDNKERISLTEHSNILTEYEDELKFLAKKRKNIITNGNINDFEGNPNNIIFVNEKEPNKKRGKTDSKKINEKKNYKNKNNKNADDIKMSQLFKVYHSLFIKSGLDCKKPSRFVDYLSNEIRINDNSLNKYNHKITFEEIKKNILNLDNKDTENILINKIINEYYHCNFENSIMEKIIKKINKLLNNQNNNIEMEKSDSLNDNNNISINNEIYDKSLKIKREKFSYSNLLVEKLNNNNYQSCLSLTNDSDYFKSIINISNKILINKNQNLINDKTILKSLEDNKKLLKSFKEENKEQSNQNEKQYLNNILTNKRLMKYVKNKLICIKQSFNNQILKNLNKNNFNKIINLLLNCKIDDIKNIELFNDSQLSNKSKNNELSLFFILLCFIFCMTIGNKNRNDLAKSDLDILNPIFQYLKRNDIFSDLKLQNKKKIKIKKIKIKKKEKEIEIGKEKENEMEKEKNNNKIKIKIENNKEFSIDKSISIEERKIEDSNKDSKIIKIILDSNDYNENNSIIKNGINKNEKINKKEPYINGLLSLKLPLSNNDNNNNNNIENTKEFIKNDIYKDSKDLNFNLMETIKNIQIKMKTNKMNKMKSNKINFQKKILKELSIGHDIFKLNYIKFKEKRGKDENKIPEKEKEIEKEKDNIVNTKTHEDSNNEEIKKIKIENNIIRINIENENEIIQKNGNKIRIYDDDFSEENKNDLNNYNYENNF